MHRRFWFVFCICILATAAITPLHAAPMEPTSEVPALNQEGEPPIDPTPEALEPVAEPLPTDGEAPSGPNVADIVHSPDAVQACSSSITYGRIYDCAISAAGEEDVFTFTAAANDSVFVRMLRTTGTLYPYVAIHDSAGGRICYDIGSSYAAVGCVLPSAGTYTIRTKDYYSNRTGEYRLVFQSWNNPGAVRSILVGQAISGVISIQPELDPYAFNARANDFVMVRLLRTTGTFYPYVAIYDSAGGRVCYDSGSSYAVLGCTLPYTGRYTIFVEDYYDVGGVGDYRISLQRRNYPANTPAIAYGETSNGSISELAELDAYRFRASANARVSVRLTRQTGTFYPYVSIFDSAGARVCYDSGSTYAEITNCLLPSTGTYFIYADDYYDVGSTGAYSLSLTCLTNPCGPTTPPRAADFSGEGKADILWRHMTNGRNHLFEMDSSRVADSDPINRETDPDWKIVGIGDFNSDGLQDILWRHMRTGANHMYLMNHSTIVASLPVNREPDLAWTVVGVADFNRDGKADILWRNMRTGSNHLYLMNGSSVSASMPINREADLDWQIVGVADFNGDQRADILWRHARTGYNHMYFMNAATITASQRVNRERDADWVVAGIGDFNGNGRADVLWRHRRTGSNHMYLMNGATIVASLPVNREADLDWIIVDVADLNGNGRSDILWRHARTGHNHAYLMNSSTIVGNRAVVREADLNWTVIGYQYLMSTANASRAAVDGETLTGSTLSNQIWDEQNEVPGDNDNGELQAGPGTLDSGDVFESPGDADEDEPLDTPGDIYAGEPAEGPGDPDQEEVLPGPGEMGDEQHETSGGDVWKIYLPHIGQDTEPSP